MLLENYDLLRINISTSSDAIFVKKKPAPTFLHGSVQPKLGVHKTKKPLSRQNGEGKPFAFCEKKISDQYSEVGGRGIPFALV